MSEDKELEKAATEHSTQVYLEEGYNTPMKLAAYYGFIAGAEWQRKQHGLRLILSDDDEVTAGLSERVEPHTLDTVYLTPTPAAITEILNKAYAAFEDANWPEHDCKWESTAPTPLLIPNKKEPTK